MTRPKTTHAATGRRWIVHKFGGSSVADAECIARVAGIIEADPHPRVAVVLSACKGVTDGLLELVALAEAQDATYLQKLAALRTRHTGCLLYTSPSPRDRQKSRMPSSA